ncbi:hypothetical protein OH807_02415 [Kitasatospora sp. NBC_01560]|uniref:hypothetical protein n=1 Tax=Kitasatospora sp. NBC_01560 TaxID=2975965 RepID=UPI003864082A
MVAAIGVLAATAALAGCGSVRADGTAAAGGTATTAAPTAVAATTAGATASSTYDYAEQARKAVAEHDRLFPQVAALGCSSARPSPSGSSTTGAPLDPEAAKHAENSGFKQQITMSAEAGCRGEAHSALITTALKAGTAGAALGEQELAGLLESLGYPRTGTTVRTVGGTVFFDLVVPGTGPCVSGQIDTAVKVAAHGPYQEGGCTEPRGGH